VGCGIVGRVVLVLVVGQAGVDVGGSRDVRWGGGCVLCLGNGVLDEAGRGGFVDCDLAFGGVLCILDFIEVLSYSVELGNYWMRFGVETPCL